MAMRDSGFLSLCFDFQYIGSSALYLPLLVRLPLLKSPSWSLDGH